MLKGQGLGFRGEGFRLKHKVLKLSGLRRGLST